MFLGRLKYRDKIRVLFIPILLIPTLGLLAIDAIFERGLIAGHEDRLKKTALMTSHNIKLTEKEMMKLVDLLRSNRTLTEYLYVATVLGGDPSAIGGLLDPYSKSLDIDTIRIYDEKGSPVVEFDRLHPDAKGNLDFEGKLPEKTIYGFRASQGMMELAAASPLVGPQTSAGYKKIIGYISAGKYIDKAYLRTLREMSGNEILIFYGDSVLASSSDEKVFFPGAGNKLMLGDVRHSFLDLPLDDMNGRSLGKITVALSDEELLKFTGRIRLSIMLIILSSAGLFVGISLLFSKALADPLRRISEFVNNISSGNFDISQAVEGTDELAELSEHLDRMRRQLLESRDLTKKYTEELESAIRERTDELEITQKKLLFAQKMEVMGQLTGGVAHEVRNPLNAIKALTDALDQELEEKSELRTYIVHLNAQVDRMAALMNELLELGKPLDESKIESHGLMELCEKAVEIWKHTALGRKLGIDCAHGRDASEIAVRMDGLKFQQIMINLLDNAAQHSPEGGSVGITIGRTGDKAELLIRDEGKGIPDGLESRVFDSFFTTRRGGTGLGLSIVKNIVEMHGGSIRIFNNNPPPGCTIEIMLPLDKEKT